MYLLNKNISVALMCVTLFVLSMSCGGNASRNSAELCYQSSAGTFKAFQKSISAKDFKTLKGLTSTLELSNIDYKSILNDYDTVSIELIPEESDGAYGIKNIGGSELYYISFNENGKRKEIKAILFQNIDDCFKIVSISNVESEVKKEIVYGVITSIVDGFDVRQVRLWSSPTTNRTDVSFCVNNEKVEVLEYSGEYVKVRKADGQEGWCLTGFLK